MELRNGAAVRQPDHHKSTENTMRGVTTVKIDISQKRGFTPPSVFHTAGGVSDGLAPGPGPGRPRAARGRTGWAGLRTVPSAAGIRPRRRRPEQGPTTLEPPLGSALLLGGFCSWYLTVSIWQP